MLERALELGHLKAGWVAGDDAFGMSPSFREGLAALGMRYVLDVPGGTTVWPLEPAWASPEYQRFGRPRKPKLVAGQRRTMEQRSDELPEGAWREITVAEGSPGAPQLPVQRPKGTSNQQAQARRHPLGRLPPEPGRQRSPATTCPTLPKTRRLETLAYVGGSRWRRETEFEMDKSDVGLDEYESRTPYQVRGRLWAGWHHHVALCLLGGAFLLSLQQAWGKKMPRITRPQVYRVVREMLPREQFGPWKLLRWLEETQERNECARRSHARRRAALRASPPIPP